MRTTLLVTLLTLGASLVSASEHLDARSPSHDHAARASKESKKAAAEKKMQKYNKPYDGPPTHFFTANETIAVKELKSKVKTLKKVVDNYPIAEGHKSPRSNIYGDWSKLHEGAAYVFTADMDVDCDGLNHQCPGNQDGYPLTDFGALSAYAVPYVVIPDRFHNKHSKELVGNNIIGVICDNKLFYGIFGDTNGDNPQVIGEASWSLARACFPKDNLNGNKGHVQKDVTYIVFTGKESVYPSEYLGKNFLHDFDHLRTTGDSLVQKLLGNL